MGMSGLSDMYTQLSVSNIVSNSVAIKCNIRPGTCGPICICYSYTMGMSGLSVQGPSVLGPAALGLWVYISGKPLMPMARLVSRLTTIKTHGSESWGQEEAGRTRRTSELLTGSTTVKFVNALNKPPLQLSLSYRRLSTF